MCIALRVRNCAIVGCSLKNSTTGICTSIALELGHRWMVYKFYAPLLLNVTFWLNTHDRGLAVDCWHDWLMGLHNAKELVTNITYIKRQLRDDRFPAKHQQWGHPGANCIRISWIWVYYITLSGYSVKWTTLVFIHVKFV